MNIIGYMIQRYYNHKDGGVGSIIATKKPVDTKENKGLAAALKCIEEDDENATQNDMEQRKRR